MCGLKTKLNNGTFDDYAKNYDIICLSETKICDGEQLLIDGFNYIPLTQETVKYRYGGIHGIAILVKDELSKYISVISVPNKCCDSVLWIKVDKDLLGFDFIIGSVYIPHENSSFYSDNVFDNLSSDIFNLNCRYKLPFCLVGDFNARTATLDDFIDTNYATDLGTLSDLPLLQDIQDSNHNLDLLGLNHNRVSCDKKTNNNGFKLIDLCKIHDLHFLNGRFGKDRNVGSYTCESSCGRSVVDYIIASSCILPYVIDFSVDILDTCLSDKHKNITAVFCKPNHTAIDHVDDVINDDLFKVPFSTGFKTKWNSNKSNEYKISFDNTTITNLSEKLCNYSEMQSNLTTKDIDSVCDDICNMLISPAVHVGITKRVHGNNNKVDNKFQNDNKPWFNNDCKKLRREYLTLKNKLGKSKSPDDANILKTKANQYKTLIKRTKQKYFHELNAELKLANANNPKKFWDIINKANNTKKPNGRINMEQLYNHFSDLNSNKPGTDGNKFDPRDVDHSINEFINSPFTTEEIDVARCKLKNNKACGPDAIYNEFIKHCPTNVIEIITKLFNIVLDTGIIPTKWTLGLIIPIYKNKGSRDDPNNYRGITILSCLGKLFTSVINSRLTSYLDATGLLGEEQAGFRANYSTTDHIFSLNSIIDIYLKHKKKLFCAFVDYAKAFDTINRHALWVKLIACNINGKLINVIYNMYNNAKSCIKIDNFVSPFFQSHVGVRQGENLSPLLFAIFLNDLESKLKNDGVPGLDFLNSLIIKHLSTDDVEIWLRLFLLLYADDTIILAESAADLQKSLNSLKDYCNEWNLSVNTSKTKVVVFSRGKIRNKPVFYFGDNIVSVCDDYTYLGVVFNYNGNFKKAINKQVTQAKHAMFSLLSKASNLQLNTDITLKLFDSLVLPILLYGCEVWGQENIEQIEVFYRNFIRRLLGVSKLTAKCMIYGEIGKYGLESTISKRIISFWTNIVTGKNSKYIYRFYTLLKTMHLNTDLTFKSTWIGKVIDVLNRCGLSFIWLNHADIPHLKLINKPFDVRLNDIDLQKWISDVHNNSLCKNYRIFKTDLSLENYLCNLDFSDRRLLSKLRCSNIKLPNNTNRFSADVDDRNCYLCEDNLLGDEFHYLFVCKAFASDRSKLIGKYFYKNPNCIKMYQLLNSEKKLVIKRLCKFIRIISEKFS